MLSKTLYATCIFILAFSTANYAQDTLPRLTVRNISNKIIISWRTTYGAKISNINIQRSPDSIKNFTTIGSVLEPNNRENGFVDSKAPNANMFYRVFIAFEGGRYIFTKSYRPFIDTTTTITLVTDPSKPVPLTPPEPSGFIPSKYIFTGKDNNVVIDLPDATNSKYSIKFFDENDNPVFEISKISEPYLIIEKVNFLHAGWFYFKLYQNGVIKEKNQFYIPKEGKVGIPAEELRRKFK
ncbi:MAG: hypothetical protein IPP72_22230 [Chitinophagaceae bacterium]|nr:hypothetical protein [Chitinophagaceae bacterium]